jgi:energy-coupling factor transporter transmembrane protein EcfT
VIFIISLICTFILKDEKKTLRNIIGPIIWVFGILVNSGEDIEINVITILFGSATIIAGAYLCMHKNYDEEK